METKKYGIALLFDRETTAKAIELSSAFLSKAGDAPLELGLKASLPHLTLFMLMLDGEGLEGVKASIRLLLNQAVVPRGSPKAFCRGDRPLNGQFTQLRAMGRALYWAQPAKRNLPLKNFHEDVVRVCVPHTHSRVPPLGVMQGENLANWEAYGYPLVLGRFHPHITLQWLAEAYAGETYDCAPWEWSSRKLVVTEMDHRGVILSNQHAATFHLG